MKRNFLLAISLSFLILTVSLVSHSPAKNQGFDPGPVFVAK
ncbi:hypothetical protein [Streptococcus marmotae]|nr:hypothetical protein [Streptococcus marmotae]